MIDKNSGNQTGVIENNPLMHALFNGQKLATGSPANIKVQKGFIVFVLAVFGTVSAFTEGGVETNLRPEGVLSYPLRFDKDVVVTGANLAVVYFEAPVT